MSAVTQEKVVEAVAVARSAVGPAIESKPVLGGQLTIKLALTPGMITLLAAPLTIAVVAAVGSVLLKSLGIPVYFGEMLGAAIVNTLGGILAALPLILLMNKGGQAIARAAIAGIPLRMGAVLIGMMLAGAGGWGLSREPLAYWVMACYAPLLMVEVATVSWLSNKAKC